MIIIKDIKQYSKIIIVCIILFLLMIGAFLIVYFTNQNIKVDNTTISVKKETKKVEEKATNIKYFYVDIKGAVNAPGVYKLEENSRIIDAINVSGGLKEDADTSIINLSKKIEDEMLIIIYTKKELSEYKNKLNTIEETNKLLNEKIICPDVSNNACANTEEEKSSELIENNIVSINTATKEQFQTLTGIGEGKAEAIVKYRDENGLFKKTEDIMNVSGIGTSVYEKIKDSITL